VNICLFTPSFLPEVGGMEIVLDKLARCFQERGHKPVVVAQRPRHNSELPSFPYDCIYYPRPRSAVWLLQYVRHVLIREHRKYHFDIIHAHMAYPNGYIAVKLREKLAVPVIITSHRGDVRLEGRYRQRRITSKRMCWAMEKADAVTAVSSEVKTIIDNLTANKANSLVIPNGVDIPPDSAGSMPESCAGITGKPFMLTLGRLHPYKGLDLLLKAMRMLCEKEIEMPHLVIAGDGKEMESLRRQTAELQLDNKVVFTGAVFGDQKHWLLRNCIFFLQPSRTEGMPLTVLEAMAYGKAIISTRTGGIMELITNNENGILVEPGDSLSLSEAIMTLRGNPNLEYMQRRARTLARQMTWPVIAERYSELYERLLKQFVFLKKGV